MSEKFDQLMNVIKSAITASEGVTAALRPTDLGMRGGPGTLAILYDDGEKMRLSVKDSTPKESEDAESE